MSKENLDQFMQKVAADEELQARIGEEIDADSLIALGTEHGFEFTAEDLAVNVELSDEELDGVAGGMHRHQHPLIMDGHKVRKRDITHLKPQPGDWAEKYDTPFGLTATHPSDSPISPRLLQFTIPTPVIKDH